MIFSVHILSAHSAGSRSDPVRAKQWGGSPIASKLGRGAAARPATRAVRVLCVRSARCAAQRLGSRSDASLIMKRELCVCVFVCGREFP